MLKVEEAFTSISVNDLGKAKEFYAHVLSLKVSGEEMGLNVRLPGGCSSIR